MLLNQNTFMCGTGQQKSWVEREQGWQSDRHKFNDAAATSEPVWSWARDKTWVRSKVTSYGCYDDDVCKNV